MSQNSSFNQLQPPLLPWTDGRPNGSNTEGCPTDTDDDEITVLIGLTICTNSFIFRASCTIQQSCQNDRPLLKNITVSLSHRGKQYAGRVLFKVLSSRYLYTVATIDDTEKAFLLHSKDYPTEAKQLEPFKAPTAKDLEDIKDLRMLTVATIRVGDRDITLCESAVSYNTCPASFYGWPISCSVLKSRWSKTTVLKNVAEKRKIQKQRNYLNDR